MMCVRGPMSMIGACLILAGTALAQDIDTGDEGGAADQSIDVLEIQEDMAAEADAFWVEEQLEFAEPVELPVISEEQFEEFLAPTEADMIDELADSEPEVIESAQAEDASDEDLEDPALGASRRANVKVFPFSAGGKLYFRTPRTAYCSAQYVADRRVLMTAAHCVYDRRNKRWYNNHRFYRAYANGNGQLASPRFIAIYKNWYTAQWPYKWDYAFICMAQASKGGHLGFRTGIPYRRFHSIGYPSNFDSGKYMQVIEGWRGRVTNGVVEMKRNSFGGGSSGGSWIGDLKVGQSGANNYAIGLNSFKYINSPKEMWGPYFDRNTWRLLRYVDARCN